MKVIQALGRALPKVALAVVLTGAACRGPASNTGVDVAFVNLTRDQAQVFWSVDAAGLASAQPDTVAPCTVMRRSFEHGKTFTVKVQVGAREDEFPIVVPNGSDSRQDRVLITAEGADYQQGAVWDAPSVPCVGS